MLAVLACTSTLAAILTLVPDRGAVTPDPDPDPGHAGRSGDVNLDGVVDFDDVIDHLFLWGPCENGLCLGDLDRDGFVDVLDYLGLLDSLDHLPLMVDARAT